MSTNYSQVQKEEEFTHDSFVIGKLSHFLLMTILSCIENDQNLRMSKPSCIENSTFLYMTTSMGRTNYSVRYESCQLIIHNS